MRFLTYAREQKLGQFCFEYSPAQQQIARQSHNTIPTSYRLHQKLVNLVWQGNDHKRRHYLVTDGRCSSPLLLRFREAEWKRTSHARQDQEELKGGLPAIGNTNI